jgi:murein DD-endopeptidase MepM/ murein hydrolase activator NlpD
MTPLPHTINNRGFIMNLLKQPIRGKDCHGSGAFDAPRSGGRKHRGVDPICKAGIDINPVIPGIVTKIGYPYNPEDEKKGHLRYVEVKMDDSSTDLRLRYHYIKPTVQVGDEVNLSTIIGFSQDLTKIFPGITPHVHFEVIENGKYINPADKFPELQNS